MSIFSGVVDLELGCCMFMIIRLGVMDLRQLFVLGAVATALDDRDEYFSGASSIDFDLYVPIASFWSDLPIWIG